MSIDNYELKNNQVHIWKININNKALDVSHLYSNVLSVDERRRAGRLRSENDKRRFVISRGLLRENLGNYMGAAPAEIVFTYNDHGKPDIKSEHNPKNIKFNVSHSRNLAIYAICLEREIGVDLEYIRDVSSADKIINRFFTNEEKDYFNSLPEYRKKMAFFRLWTRKEAYSKAKGMGIGLPLKEFDFNLIPDSTEKQTESKWSLIDIEVDSHYLAALATEGNNLEIHSYEYA